MKLLVVKLCAFLSVAGSFLTLTDLVTADLFVSAAGANAVHRFDRTTGAFLGEFVSSGSGGLGDPQGIAFGPDGNLYVSSNGSNNVLRYDGNTGAFIDIFATTAGMSWPAEINFHGGHLYVSDFSGGASGRVSRFDATTGNFVDHFVTGLSLADGTAWDSAGDLYVSNFGSNSIRKYDGVTGSLIGDFVTPGLGGLNGPLDNLFLPDGTMLVSSFNTGDVKHYDVDGNLIGTAITGLIGGAQGLELGPDGMLYVGDFSFGQIRRFDANTFESLGVFADSTSSTNNFVFRPAAVPEPLAVMPMIFLGLATMLRRDKRLGR